MSSHRFDGRKLKAFREQKAWSQKGLAHELNLNLKDADEKITDRHIRRWENEGVKPRPEILLGLAMVLDCETEDFFAPVLTEEEPYREVDAPSESLKEDLCSFQDYMQERTKDFVGRQFVFDAIDDFVGNNECGYFFVLGDPGIGKSAVAAQLVKERKYIHHFNIRAEGINRAETFLRNVCAQLVTRFELPYQKLPHDVGVDGKSLSRLLKEVSEKLSEKERAIILVDALDEADETAQQTGANILFLPQRLPKGVFFVITGRPQAYQLRLDCSQDRLKIAHDEDDNLHDIEEYLKKQVKLGVFRPYIRKQKLAQRTSFL